MNKWRISPYLFRIIAAFIKLKPCQSDTFLNDEIDVFVLAKPKQQIKNIVVEYGCATPYKESRKNYFAPNWHVIKHTKILYK